MTAPRTALDLAREGVVFRTVAGVTRCAGPPQRGDLRQALEREVEWRAATLRSRMWARSFGGRALVLAQSPTQRVGRCISCGDPLTPFRGGDCALCRLAIARLLREESGGG